MTSWIHGSLASTHFSILINGSPKGFFPALQGLRQGDPLSPFLFTLVADAFSQSLTRREEQNLFKGFQVGKEQIPISHLQYSDNTLLFLDDGKNKLRNLISLIRCLIGIRNKNKLAKNLFSWIKLIPTRALGDLRSIKFRYHFPK